MSSELPLRRCRSSSLRQGTTISSQGRMSFNYVLPTTGAFSFTSCIPSPPARLQGDLAEAGAQRGRLRDILKRLKREDDKETLAVIKVAISLQTGLMKIIEDYLPYLFSVDHCLDHGIFMPDKEIGKVVQY